MTTVHTLSMPLAIKILYYYVLNLDFGVTFEPLVDSVSEDAGVIEAFKVVKKGRTEKTVTISLFILVAPASELE